MEKLLPLFCLPFGISLPGRIASLAWYVSPAPAGLTAVAGPGDTSAGNGTADAVLTHVVFSNGGSATFRGAPISHGVARAPRAAGDHTLISDGSGLKRHRAGAFVIAAPARRRRLIQPGDAGGPRP